MRRELLAVDTKAARAHAAAHHRDKIVESERLATARATKLNGQEETNLITTTQELDDTLEELGIGATKKVLSAQINKRTGFLGRQYPISAVPMEYRAVKAPAAGSYHKIKMSPSNGRCKDEYCTALVKLMIIYDAARTADTGTEAAPRVARKLHCISSAYTSTHSTATQARMQSVQLEKAKTQEDPLAAQLHKDFQGDLLLDYDYEGNTYRVVDIRWRERAKEWVAGSAVVIRTTTGEWGAPAHMSVGGGDSAVPVFKKEALEDFVLADLPDPHDHKFQTYVSAMMEAHTKRE
jgi:hypothetical protein